MKRLNIRKLDWYLFSRFIATFAVAIVLIIGIVIIFDISEKIDDFVQNEAPLREIIFNYYLNFVPYFINMFSPLFVFITVIFFTSRLAANSEIIAILSGGISYRRMLLPYMMAATLITMLSLGLNLYVIPKSNTVRQEFETQYFNRKRNKSFRMRDTHYQIAPGQFAYVESFSNWNKTAYKFTLENFEDGKLTSKLSAESAVWDSTIQGWHLKRYFIRDYTTGLQDHIRSGEQLDTVIALTVSDFYMNEETVQTLSYGQLTDLIDTQKMRGDANVMFSEIELQRRWALPFSAFILTIMGVSLSSRKKRGGIGWNIAMGIALAFSYILFLRFSEMFVYTGTLPAAVALWLPNFIYAIIAAVLYKYAQK